MWIRSSHTVCALNLAYDKKRANYCTIFERPSYTRYGDHVKIYMQMMDLKSYKKVKKSKKD